MTSTPPFRDRLAWHDGGIWDGDIRYLMLRTDSLMGLFHRLDRETRIAALDAFADSLAENGRKSIEARMRRLNMSGEQLYDELAKSSAWNLGWGTWTYRRIDLLRFEVDVADSPFVHGYGRADHEVCSPIKGMLQAIGNLVFGCTAVAQETSCAAMSGGCCRFVVTRS
jgi:predicted hydrocarbon binding protein